jgi:hypothetical protein
VGAATELNVANCGFPSSCERHDVVEFQENSLGASASGADERATGIVAPPDFPSYRRWDVTGPRSRLSRRARSARRGELPSLQCGEQNIQSALEHSGGIPVWSHVPEQRLRAPQLLVRFA